MGQQKSFIERWSFFRFARLWREVYPDIRRAGRRGALVGQQKEKEFERVPFFLLYLFARTRFFDFQKIPFPFYRASLESENEDLQSADHSVRDAPFFVYWFCGGY